MRKFLVSSCFALTCLTSTVQAAAISVSGYEYEPGPAVSVISNASADVALEASDVTPLVSITPVFEDVRFVSGSDGSVNKLGSLAAGSYQLTLTDFEFPVAFDELKVALTTATQVISILSLTDTNSISQIIQLAANESYYLSVFASTSAPSVYGLYGVQLAQYSPVPLPASALLLMSGLLCVGMASKRRKQQS